MKRQESALAKSALAKPDHQKKVEAKDPKIDTSKKPITQPGSKSKPDSKNDPKPDPKGD